MGRRSRERKELGDGVVSIVWLGRGEVGLADWELGKGLSVGEIDGWRGENRGDNTLARSANRYAR